MSPTAFVPMKKPCRALAAALTLLGIVLVPQMARADCSASPEALQSLCQNPALAQPWTSMETKIATLKQSNPDLAPALEDDQALFLRLLDKTYSDVQSTHPAEEVPEVMLLGLIDRMDFLDRLDLDRSAGLEGYWENAAGAISVSPQIAGVNKAQLLVHEPIIGANTCSLDGTGKVQSGLLTVELDPQGLEELSLSRAGDQPLLGADLTRSGRPTSVPLDCADSPPVSGWYFAANPLN